MAMRTILLLLWQPLACMMNSDVISLHIGVIPPWTDFINQAISDRNSNFDIYTTELLVDNTKSEFDRLIAVNKKIVENKIHLVLGPFDSTIAIVTDKQNIPYISMSTVNKNTTSVFELVPPLSGFHQSILDLAKYNGWKQISLFYDDDEGTGLVEKLVSYEDMEFVKSWRLARRASPNDIRRNLLRMRTALLQMSVISCNKENTREILDQARSLAMLTTPYAWLVYDSGFGLESVFKDFPDIAVNFTTIGLLEYDPEYLEKNTIQNRLSIALAFDSVTLLNNSISYITDSSTQGIRQGIFDSLKQVNVKGVTRNIQFSTDGQRFNYSISLTEVSDSLSHQVIAEWFSHPYNGFNFQFQNRKQNNRTLQFPLKGRKIKIVTILEKPFTMLKRDHLILKGNDKYQGYAIDLIAEIAKRLEFEYDLYLVHDGKFGSKMANGEWNGMIGEVLAGNATMTIAPISISAKREEAVDFTKPFMNRYINVIMKAPKVEQSYFDFLNPFHPVVWLCTFGAFFIVSIILYILEKFSAAKKDNHAPNVFIKECFWFMFGSLLHSSTDATPTSLPGRTLTSFWFFFSLIIVSSYTANLAAFLTVKKINSPINSVTDLASQSKIKYGTVESSGVLSFFTTTKIQHFSKMGAQMAEIDPGSLVKTTADGFERVKQGDYAFFWDSTVNKYMTIENCGLMEIGPPFAPKDFGIAVPPGAIYREELSMTILRLSDVGTLNTLQNKWWGQSTCPDVLKPTADETSELQIENVAGIFFILGSGIGLALLVCVAQYLVRFLCREQTTNKYPKNDLSNAM